MKENRQEGEEASGDRCARSDALSDAMSFKISRLAELNDRLGTHHFRNELGVTLSEWRVLGLVAEGNPATTRSIRQTLLMDRGLLSRVIKELTDRGFLTSQLCPADKRQTLLRLTASGWRLHEKGIAFTRDRNRSMASVLSRQEKAQFIVLLDRMVTHNARLWSMRKLNND